MVRLVPRAFAATVALLAAGFSPATASADPVLVFPGMEIRQDNHVCTLGYVDPALKIAFTAGHCRGGGAVTSRDYKVRPSQGLPGQHTQRLHRGHARVDRRLRGDCAG